MGRLLILVLITKGLIVGASLNFAFIKTELGAHEACL